MDSYTYCSDKGVAAVIENLPPKYAMELNRSDMTNLVSSLRLAYHFGNEWAGEFLSSIAETVDIEFV